MSIVYDFFQCKTSFKLCKVIKMKIFFAKYYQFINALLTAVLVYDE